MGDPRRHDVWLHIVDTGEVLEISGSGVDNGEPWEASSLALALGLVERLTDAIDRARQRGEIARVQVRFDPQPSDDIPAPTNPTNEETNGPPPT